MKQYGLLALSILGVAGSIVLLLAPYVSFLKLPYNLYRYLVIEAWKYLVPLLLASGLLLTVEWARRSWYGQNRWAKISLIVAVVANTVIAFVALRFFSVSSDASVGPNFQDLYALLISAACLIAVVPMGFYSLFREQPRSLGGLVVVLGLTPTLVYNLMVWYASAYIGFGFK
jgi:hypothetical protein